MKDCMASAANGQIEREEIDGTSCKRKLGQVRGGDLWRSIESQCLVSVRGNCAAPSESGDMHRIQCYGTRAELVGEPRSQAVSAERDTDDLAECVAAQSWFRRHIARFDEL